MKVFAPGATGVSKTDLDRGFLEIKDEQVEYPMIIDSTGATVLHHYFEPEGMTGFLDRPKGDAR